MELIDTYRLMVSNNYKDRFRAEYYQTKIRRDKLYKMLLNYNSGKLEFEPTNVPLLKIQLSCMDSYISVLELRAIEEEIDL